VTDLALLGATGAIGKSVVAALTARNTPFRLIGRSLEKMQAEFGAHKLASFAAWNPDDQSLQQAFAGITTVVSMIGVPYDRFALHPQLMKQTVAAAKAAGVKRLLLIGTLYVFGKPQSPRIAETHPRAPHTFKGRVRKEQEDILMNSGLEAAVLRLPDFYGPGVEASMLHDVFAAAVEKRKANVIGPLGKPHEFVFVPDVGPVVAALLDAPGAFGKAWNLGGAGTITQYEAASLAFGGKPRLRSANKFLLRLMGLFNPFLRELVEMYYLMTDPLIVDDGALTKLLGGIAKTPYRQGIALCVAAEQRKRRQA
jgi:nucleoside-diphosphate-sugar epimerase